MSSWTPEKRVSALSGISDQQTFQNTPWLTPGAGFLPALPTTWGQAVTSSHTCILMKYTLSDQARSHAFQYLFPDPMDSVLSISLSHTGCAQALLIQSGYGLKSSCLSELLYLPREARVHSFLSHTDPDHP